MASKALLVGINAYGGPNDLPSCVQDAQSFNQLLSVQYGFDDIRLLRDGEATKDNVVGSLKWLLTGSQPDDRLVFFYSGHGYQPIVDGEMREAIVSQDAQFIDDLDLSKAMSTAPDGVLTIVLDTCFSGGLEKVFIIDEVGQVRHTAASKYWKPPGNPDTRHERLENVARYRRFGTLLPSTSKGYLPSEPGATITTLKLPASKGLLMSAAQASETASASTPETDGLSAFTYCLIESVRALGKEASASSLVLKSGSMLHGMNVPQTPALKQPIAPPNLGDRAFVTLRQTSGATPHAPTPNLAPSSKTETAPMPNYAFPGSIADKGFDPSAASSSPPLDKAWYDAVANIVSTIVPAIIPVVASAVAKKGYEAGASQPAQPQMDKAWYDTVASIVSTIVPAVIPVVASAISKKDYQAGTSQPGQPQMDKAWYDTIASIVSTVVPAILPAVASAVTKKDYQAGPGQPQRDKAWYDSVFEAVKTVAPIVVPIALAAL